MKLNGRNYHLEQGAYGVYSDVTNNWTMMFTNDHMIDNFFVTPNASFAFKGRPSCGAIFIISQPIFNLFFVCLKVLKEARIILKSKKKSDDGQLKIKKRSLVKNTSLSAEEEKP